MIENIAGNTQFSTNEPGNFQTGTGFVDPTTPEYTFGAPEELFMRRPFVLDGDSLTIFPERMNVGTPYVFEFQGKHLLGVHKGEHVIDIYSLPPFLVDEE